MGMLLTTLAFAVLTAALVAHHVRRGAAAPGQACAPVAACPRCKAAIAPGTTRCSRCGVPLQAFEVVAAAKASEEVSEGGDKLHAVVRADLCVGCGSCVSVCPEPGAIRMDHKLAVVAKALCVGHGKCAEACPVGAIIMSTGAAVHRVEVPEIDIHFESNVPGVYVVGELGGRGLIKNAINEGKIAVEHIADELGGGSRRSPDTTGVHDVVIVGSGPAGLSSGLQALQSKLRYAVLEQGTLADTIRKYPRAKLLLAEPVTVPLYGDLWVADASKESLLKVWETVIASTGLQVRTGQRVVNVARHGDLLHVATPDAVFRTRRVVLATGRRGTPRRLGVPGEELGKVIYDIAEMECFAGQRMLVVGGGDSAVESALGLARQPGTVVTLSYRGDSFSRAKERNRTKLETAVAEGSVRALLRSEVRAVHEQEVEIEVAGKRSMLPNDTVVVRIGGEPPAAFLKQIGIRIVKKDVPLPQGEEAMVG
jgi:thioredoxin reductase (NADPH)